ncbi:unnamed protein product [Gongylonema pulchrum]|uniref:RYDR_ITPR domain-containing protein n=1 Tax=Gongylonema pulchrum TaxID=637853 RepID=A0A183DGX5_9BILA|nr:unnamed protein product [Gongylonema pulchrum]
MGTWIFVCSLSILDVLYCVLTESPEALNMINEGHIKSVISLLEKVGRDPKVLDVLSSLCEGNGMAVRSSQNTITRHLLPGKDLLLQTKMRDHVSRYIVTCIHEKNFYVVLINRYYLLCFGFHLMIAIFIMFGHNRIFETSPNDRLLPK